MRVMSKKGTENEMMTGTQFAEKMGVNYTTVVRWLKRKIVPGAELRESPTRGKWWEIPPEALQMERPRWGGPPGGTRKARAKTAAKKAGKRAVKQRRGDQ